MKKLLLILALIPNIAYSETQYVNDRDVTKIITYHGNGESEFNGTQAYCDGAKIVYMVSGRVVINLSCNINSGTIIGETTDDSIIKINFINFDMNSYAEGMCEIDNQKEYINCYGRNLDQNYSFKFKVSNF